MMARDRIDRGRPACRHGDFQSVWHRTRSKHFNSLAGDIHDSCMTVLNHAALINAKFPHAFSNLYSLPDCAE